MNDTTFKVRDEREPGRYYLDNDLLDRFGGELGAYGIAVYNALARYADKSSETCFPSFQTVAKLLSMSRRQVIRETEKLERLHIIHKEHQCREKPDGEKRHFSNRYTLLHRSLWGSASDAPSSDCESPDQPQSSNLGESSADGDPKQIEVANNDDDDCPHADLLGFGMQRKDAMAIINKVGSENTQKWVRWVRDPRNEIRNPGGYLRTCILVNGNTEPPEQTSIVFDGENAPEPEYVSPAMAAAREIMAMEKAKSQGGQDEKARVMKDTMAELRTVTDEVTFMALEDTSLVSLSETRAVLEIPSGYARGLVQTGQARQLEEILRQKIGRDVEITYV